jgi:hypothetical protein
MPVEFLARPWKSIRQFPKGRQHIGPSQYGFANRLRACLGLPEGREADAIVGVADRDGAKYQARLDDLKAGRQTLGASGKGCAVGLAIEKIEAWLLADEQALRSACDDPHIQRQPDPETLDAANEAHDRHPKGRLTRLMTQAEGDEIPVGEFPERYAAIAQVSDLHCLETRCRQGFAPFASQVRLLPGGAAATTGAPPSR